MAFAAYKFLVDWENTGLFAGTYDDITAHVLSFSCYRGRDNASQLTGRCNAGNCQMTLDNTLGYYSPLRSAGPLYGKLVRGRKIKVQMSVNGGAFVTIWAGFTETVIATPGVIRSENRAELRGVGPLGRTLDRKVRVLMEEGITTGTAIGKVLDAVNWDPTARTIDTGRTTMNRWWTGETPGITALRDLEETEAGFLVEGKGGQIVFEDRGHRLASPHTVSQATYTNASNGTIRYATIQQVDTSGDVYNVMKATIHTFDVSEDPIVLWVWEGKPPILAPGESIVITAQFPTPDLDGSYIAVDDWQLFTAFAYADEFGGGADYTSYLTFGTPVKTGTSYTITITLGAGCPANAHLTKLQLDGVAVIEGDTIEVSEEDETSKDDFGEREFTFNGRYIQSVKEAKAFCSHYLAIYKDPVTALSVELVANASEAHLTEAQTRDISDRITIDADDDAVGLGINEDFYVEAIEHQIEQNGLHTMRLQLSAVTEHDWDIAGDPYTPKVIVIDEGGGQTLPVPDDLIIDGYSTQTQTTSIITVITKAKKWNAAIDTGTRPTLNACQCRAKFYAADETLPKYVDLRTVAEGGTFADNGNDQRIWTNIPASYEGAAKSWTYNYAGTWFIAMRLMNDSGWSVWTDGNDNPERVTFTIACKGTPAAGEEPDLPGPPSQWSVSWKPGNTPYTLIATATRPRVHGERIFFVGFQVRGPGEWLPPDATDSPGYVSFDGSELSFSYSEYLPLQLFRNDPPGSNNWGSAKIGDIAWVDVRDYAVETEATWDVNYCIPILFIGFGGGQDGEVTAYGTPVAGDATYLLMNTQITIPGNFGGTDLRLKICNPMWNWMTGGYMGYIPTKGFGYPKDQPWEIYDAGDTVSGEWVSEEIPYDPSVPFESLSVRAYFGNDYSWSYDSAGSDGNAAGGRCINLTDANPIVTDAGLAGEYDEKMFRWQGSEDRTLAAPVNAVCGQTLRWCFINTGSTEIVITLDSAFRVGKILPELERPFDVTGDLSYLPGRITEDENYSP